MTILDNLLTFDPIGTAITATADSTNVIDLSQNRDIGIGDSKAIDILFDVTTTFLSAGATTLTITVQTSTDNSSYTTLVSTPAIAKASLVAGGEQMLITVPAGVKRYLKLNYAVATGPFTAGAIYAGLNVERQANQGAFLYPSGFSTTYI